MNFSDLLLQKSNETLTENGALTNASTFNACVDLFAIGGSMRSLDVDKKKALFINALLEDLPLAAKIIFWIGDIRQGAGERQSFKEGLTVLGLYNHEALEKLVKFIPEYSRWDYVYTMLGLGVDDEVARVIRVGVADAIKSQNYLIFKWLKSESASSLESKRLAKWTARVLGLAPKEYRKMLTKYRTALGDAVVEHKMSANEWKDIDLEKVPSKASLKYSRAFRRHDINYAEYIKAVSEGKAKMNASVTFPYEILHFMNANSINRSAGEAAWKSMPNFLPNKENIIYMVDTSNSMNSIIVENSTVMAREVAFSLGIYGSERLSGVFKDKVLAFSETARFFDLSKYDTVFDKYLYLNRNCIVENTNIQAAFKLILDTAVEHDVPQKDMPTTLMIISDMEFDRCAEGTNYTGIRRLYEKAGYTLPKIIFWNVNARNTQFPVTVKDSQTALISGYSPAIAKQALTLELISPTEVMLATIDTERYAPIGAALAL